MKIMTTIKSDKGTSAVEFALVLPLLVFIVFGIIEFGFVLYDKAVITNASREAARRASVYNPPGFDSIKADIVSDYGNLPIQVPAKLFTASDISITSNSPAGHVTASVQYSYTFFILPDLQVLFGGTTLGTVSLTGTTIMRME